MGESGRGGFPHSVQIFPIRESAPWVIVGKRKDDGRKVYPFFRRPLVGAVATVYIVEPRYALMLSLPYQSVPPSSQMMDARMRTALFRLG